MLKRLGLFLTIFNLDMVLVLSSVVALWHLQHGEVVNWGAMGVLILSVWLGYQADHWMDAAKTHRSLWCPNRLRLLWKLRYPMLFLWCLGLVANVWLALHVLPEQTIYRGLILMMAGILYVFSVQLASSVWKKILSKEWMVSTLLVCAMMLLLPKVSWVEYSSLVGVYFLFWQNCRLIAQFEAALDHKLSMPSLINRTSPFNRLWVFGWLFSAILSIYLGHYWMFAAVLVSGVCFLIGKKMPLMSYRSSMDAYIWMPFGLFSIYLFYG